MKAKLNREIAARVFDSQEILHRANVHFLKDMKKLESEFPNEFVITEDEKKYIDKKIKLLSDAIEVIGIFHAGKCDADNCNKALDLIDDQIDILES